MSEKIALSQIGQIAIPVRDLDAAVVFYRDALGMKFLFQFPGLAFFDCGGVRLLLETAAEEAQKRSSIIYYKVHEIQAAYQTLRAAGVEFIEAPNLVAKMPDHDLWMAFFNDPDQNVLALMCEVPRA